MEWKSTYQLLSCAHNPHVYTCSYKQKPCACTLYIIGRVGASTLYIIGRVGASTLYIIGRVGASPPSLTNGMIFLYTCIYISIVRRALNVIHVHVRASFSPIFKYFSCYYNHVTSACTRHVPWIQCNRRGFLIRQPGKRHFAKEEKGVEAITVVSLDTKYQRCQVLIVLTVINRTQTSLAIVQEDVHIHVV